MSARSERRFSAASSAFFNGLQGKVFPVDGYSLKAEKLPLWIYRFS
jgi:hypothetical protein